ncbi:hypothetical protein RN001_004242 [Aquatica leii]|uniref:acid phosphatase n=1 Tax=Aquatica leii TaxID=1421715 RepID=A0AAN7QJF1_9COLE|nr:hypothetical protein RN001_004242 [Aquatica leii]
MEFRICLAIVLLTFDVSLCLLEDNNATTATLKALHLVFRHGHRTTERVASLIYPNHPHKNEEYYPYGYGQLTNEGKTASYELGVFLKKQYGQFLGRIYQPALIDAVSTGTLRASTTLSFLLTGLFAPENTPLERSKPLNWKSSYRELSPHDKLLLSPFNNNCSSHQQSFQGFLRAKTKKKVLQTYARIYQHIQEKTKTNLHPLQRIAGLFDIIVMPKETNFKRFLWNKRSFFSKNFFIDFYLSSSSTSEFKQLTGGFLLKKILQDTRLKLDNKINPTERKMFLYSAHDTTVFYILRAMELSLSDIPDFTGCVIVEIHKINSIDSVRILYRDLNSFNVMIVPGCTEFCPLTKFVKIVEKNIPSDDLFKMRFKVYSITTLLIFGIPFSLLEENNATTATLKALHILFRHGHRTTEKLVSSIYPSDPHKDEKYYPYGFGQLTNEGKRKAFELGQWLRKRYNAFLGTTYHPETIDAVSSGYNRTAATLSLVLAGLYPPKGTDLEWNENLNWQPVIYIQLPQIGNYLNFAFATCPKFMKLFSDYLNTSQGKAKIQFYKPLIDYVQENSGGTVSPLFLPFFLYDILATQQEWGLELPKWTNIIYPNILYSANLDFFAMQMATTEMRRFNAGPLLEKIIKNTALKISNTIEPPERKIFIYSGHDLNLIFLQTLLGVYTSHRPSYGACLMIEVHQINKVYGIKIYYDTKTKGNPEALKIPGCDYFCPFKKFYKLVKHYLPTKDTNCTVTTDEQFDNFASIFQQ